MEPPGTHPTQLQRHQMGQSMTPVSPESPFPDVLRHFRKHYGLTQQQLADRLEISRNTLKSWEKNDPKRQPHVLTQEGVEHRLARIEMEELDGQL